MAAYSAVVCFEQLLDQLLSSDHFANQQVYSLKLKVSSLKESIDRIFPAKTDDIDIANDLGARIRDTVYAAQDSIESFVLGESLRSESKETADGQKISSFSLQEIEASMDPIIVDAGILALSIGKNKKELSYKRPLTSTASERSTKTMIVGQEKDKERVTAKLLSEESRRKVIPITGMPGIGKTTLARSIFDDPDIRDEFPYRTWVTVSQDYNVAELLAKLLISMESKGRKGGETEVEVGSAASMMEKLHQTLYNNRYLVVIDDLWDDKHWMEILNSLPDKKNRSRILLTTRMRNVAQSVKTSSFIYQMEPLNKEAGWSLLSQMTFGEAPCPPQLVKIGKKIAKNCHGLPLTLVVIGGLLSQERKTEEYWTSFEADTYAAVAKGAAHYLEILSLSYNYLPSKLKGCFLYMAAFPQDTEIVVSKLIKLWVAEGFLTQRSPHENIEQVAEQSLLQLIDRNLVIVHKNSSSGRVKTCRVHGSLRDLAQKEAEKEKFLYSVKKQVKEMEQGPESQRRVSVHETVLMCKKQVYQSTNLIRLARSLLYVGPVYPHPLPFSLTFQLLRVFDAFTVFFLEFPDEIIKLIHLRYLSFTFNGELPASISNLKNLQVLMVRRQFKIIFVGVSFIPEEIWNMSQLRHLVFTESDLPRPCGVLNSSVLLANLQYLSNVSAASCTKEVLQNMPNLKKLVMWTDAPGDVELYVDQLNKLESFKFTVLNPDPDSTVHFLPKLSFPETLRKLSLSGCGLPWEDMEVIQKLPNLQVLKLLELAFNGDEWWPTDEFKNLKFLMIEYLNLKWLEIDDSHFPCLQHLILRHCYELEGIDMDIGRLIYMELIELVDCSPDAVEAAEYIRKQQNDLFNKQLHVVIYSSSS